MDQALTCAAQLDEIDWALVQADYENPGISVKAICTRYGISASQLRTRRELGEWTLRGRRRVRQPTLIALMFRVLYRQVLNLEKQMGDESNEKNATLLGTFAKTFEKLQELEKAGDTSKSSDRKDIRDLRAKVASRLEQLKRE